MSEQNGTTRRKRHHQLDMGEIVKASKMLEKMKDVLVEDKPDDRELGDRLGKLLGFEVSSGTAARLKKITGITWRCKASSKPGKTYTASMMVLTDAVINLHKQLGVAVMPELKHLYDMLKAIKTEQAPSTETAS